MNKAPVTEAVKHFGDFEWIVLHASLLRNFGKKQAKSFYHQGKSSYNSM